MQMMANDPLQDDHSQLMIDSDWEKLAKNGKSSQFPPDNRNNK